ncbi:hypothetical protein LEMLEM_LOCUS5979, partial [Lemmus lemmus]
REGEADGKHFFSPLQPCCHRLGTYSIPAACRCWGSCSIFNFSITLVPQDLGGSSAPNSFPRVGILNQVFFFHNHVFHMPVRFLQHDFYSHHRLRLKENKARPDYIVAENTP